MYHIWRHSRVTALLLNCSCTFGPLLFTFNTRLHFTIHITGSPSVTLKIYVYSILFIVLYLAMSVQPIYKLFTTSIRWSVTDFFVTFLFLLALWFFWGFFSVCKLFKIVMYESHMFNCIHLFLAPWPGSLPTLQFYLICIMQLYYSPLQVLVHISHCLFSGLRISQDTSCLCI